MGYAVYESLELVVAQEADALNAALIRVLVNGGAENTPMANPAVGVAEAGFVLECALRRLRGANGIPPLVLRGLLEMAALRGVLDPAPHVLHGLYAAAQETTRARFDDNGELLAWLDLVQDAASRISRATRSARRFVITWLVSTRPRRRRTQSTTEPSNSHAAGYSRNTRA